METVKDVWNMFFLFFFLKVEMWNYQIFTLLPMSMQYTFFMKIYRHCNGNKTKNYWKKTEGVVNPDFKIYFSIFCNWTCNHMPISSLFTVYHKNVAMQHRSVVAMEIIIAKISHRNSNILKRL